MGGFVGYSVNAPMGMISDPATWFLNTRSVPTIGEHDHQLEQTSLPDGLFLAGDSTLPRLHVSDPLSVALRPGIKPERVVATPLTPALGQYQLR